MNELVLSPNAAALEIGWTAFALIIEILALHSAMRALSAIVILKHEGMSWADELVVLAIKRFRGTVRVCWFEMVFIMIGIVAMRTPPRISDRGIDADLAGILVFIGFISLEFIDFTFLIWDEIDWNYIAKRLVKATRVQHEHEHDHPRSHDWDTREGTDE